MEHVNFWKKLRGIFLLLLWLCSILLLIGTPDEIKNVYSVKNAPAEKVEIKNITLTSESCRVRNYCDHIKFEAIHLDTGLPVESRIEVAPGIFDFGVSFQRKEVWSTKRKYIDQYQVGKVYDVYLGENGSYYLSQGSYFPFAYLFVFAVLWIAGNAVLIAKKANEKG